MFVFYSEAPGRANVAADSPADEPYEIVLSIFRSLDTQRGFLGIPLQKPLVLQLLPSRNSVRIELLDTSKPAVESCEVNKDVAEQLIKAASKGLDVSQIAHGVVGEWDHMDL